MDLFFILQILFDPIRLVIIKQELLCLADPLLFLDLYMFPKFVIRHRPTDIIQYHQIRDLCLKPLFKAELFIFFLEISDELQGGQ